MHPAPELASVREVWLDPVLYPQECVKAARSAFADRCDVSGGGTRPLRITPRPGTTGDVVDEFLTHALRLALEAHLAVEPPSQ